MQLKSTLKCLTCGHTEQVIMPLDYCQFSYDCKSCHEIMKAKQGYCCVFCSYGDVPRRFRNHINISPAPNSGALSGTAPPWFNMLIFHCSDCNETINSADDESVKQIFDRLDEHVRKCPLATFTFEGTTDVARERVDNLRSVIKRLAGKIQPH